MTRRRSANRGSGGDVTCVIIRSAGRKAVKDVDLAASFGVTLADFYRRLDGKLLQLPRGSMFQIAPAKRARQSRPVQRSLAFTQSGVIFVAAFLGDERIRRTGVKIARALKTRRRSSKTKKRASRRSSDPAWCAAYEKVLARLQAILKKILGS